MKAYSIDAREATISHICMRHRLSNNVRKPCHTSYLVPSPEFALKNIVLHFVNNIRPVLPFYVIYRSLAPADMCSPNTHTQLERCVSPHQCILVLGHHTLQQQQQQQQQVCCMLGGPNIVPDDYESILLTHHTQSHHDPSPPYGRGRRFSLGWVYANATAHVHLPEFYKPLRRRFTTGNLLGQFFV